MGEFWIQNEAERLGRKLKKIAEELAGCFSQSREQLAIRRSDSAIPKYKTEMTKIQGWVDKISKKGLFHPGSKSTFRFGLN
jgi:cysteinyl-tRNA synthetase